MDHAVGLLAVVALIVANGWFVAAEFAFVAARRGRLEEAAGGGDRKAARAVEVHRRLSFMLSGAQLGITVTSLVLGFIAEPTLGAALAGPVGWFGVAEQARSGVALTAAFAIATASQMIFGELAPKNLAIAKPEPVARALAPGIWAYMRIAAPLIRVFDSSANALLRAVGIEPVEELPGGVTVEELDLIVEESARRGSLTGEDAERLSRALHFRELQAADAMVPRTRVVAVEVAATGAELRRLLAGHTRFPVTATSGDLDDLVGVVHVGDLLAVPEAARDTVTVGRIMRAPLAVPETLPLSGVLAALRQSRTALAVVVDEHGGTAGIITLEDLVEELVGEIADEHEPDAITIERLDDRRWAVPGWWRIDEIARDTGISLPSGDYETVGGLLMQQLGQIPHVGDQVEVPGATVEVTAMEGRAVTRAVLSRAEGEPPPPDVEGNR